MNETIKLANSDNGKRERTALGVFTPEVQYFLDARKGTFIDEIRRQRNNPPSRPTTTPPPQRSNPLAFPNVVYRETHTVTRVVTRTPIIATLFAIGASVVTIVEKAIVLGVLPAVAATWAPTIALIALSLAGLTVLYRIKQLFEPNKADAAA